MRDPDAPLYAGTETREAAAAQRGRGFLRWVLLAFAVGIVLWLRGVEADEFRDKSRGRAEAACAGDAACLEQLRVHFDACFDAHHTSERSGRYSRRFALDEAGFGHCVDAARAAGETL
ncbi:MAG: hypothetical protein MJE66_11925 [Proteobacteria bacterium]|nr:hypothetical protein [Pseudomonadota bacterium]